MHDKKECFPRVLKMTIFLHYSCAVSIFQVSKIFKGYFIQRIGRNIARWRNSLKNFKMECSANENIILGVAERERLAGFYSS